MGCVLHITPSNGESFSEWISQLVYNHHSKEISAALQIFWIHNTMPLWDWCGLIEIYDSGHLTS